MLKRKRRWPRVAGNRIVSFAAVGLATAALMGLLPRMEENGFFVNTASALSEVDSTYSADSQAQAEIPALQSIPEETLELEAEWTGILFDYARMKNEELSLQEAFPRELMARLEALSKYDLENFSGKKLMYELYTRASTTLDVLERADAFDSNCTLACSVFGELARIKKGGVFTRGGQVEYAKSVLQAAIHTQSFFARDEAVCLQGTQLEINREELFALVRAAADFLVERMNALENEVTPEQYIVYRYALGGGWEEHTAPDWLAVESLYRLAEIVRETAIEELFSLELTV